MRRRDLLAGALAFAATPAAARPLMPLHETPREMLSMPFVDGDGRDLTLADFRGRVVLLNVWATWCAPCREEMPTLSALQTEFGDDSFEVVTLATGRNSPAGIVKFFDEQGITNLPRHQDQKQAIARDMAVLGLPVTVILNPEGEEIARLMGEADRYSDSARAIINALKSGS